MQRVLAVVCALACGCDGTSSSTVDGGADDGDGGGGGGDGQTASPRTIELTLTNRPTNAAPFSFFVAYQDGAAEWKAAPAPTGDTYSFEVTAPVYGVAWGCIGNLVGNTTTSQLRSISTAHFAVAERTELTFDVPSRCTDRNPPTITLSGQVTNRPFNGVLVVQFGTRTAFVSNQTGGFQLQTPPGTRDLIISHVVPLGNGEYYIDEALVVRSLALTQSTTRQFDFFAARETRWHEVTVNVPGRVLATTMLYTANGTEAALTRVSTDWGSSSLASAQAIPSDVYDQSITVTTLGASATVTNATSTPGAQTYAAPAPLGTVAATVSTKSPYITLEAAWPAYASTVGYAWNATQQLASQQCGGNLACTISWTALLSPGVSGMMPGYRMPDLSAVSGWKSAFALAGNVQIVGSVTAQTSSAGASDFPPPVPASGTKRTFVRSDFTVMP